MRGSGLRWLSARIAGARMLRGSAGPAQWLPLVWLCCVAMTPLGVGCQLIAYELDEMERPDGAIPVADGSTHPSGDGGGLDGAEAGPSELDAAALDAAALDATALDSGALADTSTSGALDATQRDGAPTTIDAARDANAPADGSAYADADVHPETDATVLPIPDAGVVCTGDRCNYRCPAGAPECALTCLSARECSGHCVAGSECTALCQGAEHCHFECPPFSSCDITCRNSAECQVKCANDAICHVTCIDNDCRGIACEARADCTLNCLGSSVCAFSRCDAPLCQGAVMYCGGQHSCPDV